MRRRRINTILFILILISCGFFGTRYYLEKNNISINLDSIFKNSEKKISMDNKSSAQEKKPEVTVQSPPAQTPPASQQNTSSEENKVLFYEYKLSDGKSLKVEYADNQGKREFKGIKSDNQIPSYDISEDKSRIVFEDNVSKDIIVMDSQGNAKKADYDFYKSKSTGVTITKVNVYKYYPQYIWAAKPHFVPDGGVVFISHLPFVKNYGVLYLWSVGTNGQMRMVGSLGTKDINAVTYEGYTSDGKSLKIKSGSNSFYFTPGHFQLVK
jgi:hypothetical protein